MVSRVIEFHGEDSLRVKFAFCGEDAARGAVLTGKEKKRKEKKRKEKKRKEKKRVHHRGRMRATESTENS